MIPNEIVPVNEQHTTTEEIPQDKTPTVVGGEKKREEHEGVMCTWDSQASAVRTSIDPGRPNGRALISQCLEQADLGITAMISQTLEVTDYFAHVADLAQESTGEIEAKIRLVLILEDGRKVSTWSPSFIKGFAFVVSSQPPGPWEPPLLLRVKGTKGKSGFQYATCSEVIRETQIVDPTKSKSKPKT